MKGALIKQNKLGNKLIIPQKNVSIPVISIPGWNTNPKPIISKPPVVSGRSPQGRDASTDDPKDVPVLVIQPIPESFSPKREILPEKSKPDLIGMKPILPGEEKKKKKGGSFLDGFSPVVDIITIPLGPIGKIIKPIGESATQDVTNPIQDSIIGIGKGVGKGVSDVAQGVGKVGEKLLNVGDNFLDFLSNPLMSVGLIVVGGVVVSKLIK